MRYLLPLIQNTIYTLTYILSRPVPFKATIEPRFEEVQSLILQAMEIHGINSA